MSLPELDDADDDEDVVDEAECIICDAAPCAF